MKVVWLTDVHLNFCNKAKRIIFYDSIKNEGPDHIIITGDIGESKDFKMFLKEMYLYLNTLSEKTISISYVLGNHDFWGSSIRNVRAKLRAMDKNYYIYYLTKVETNITLTNDTILLGVDGFADARAGDYDSSSIVLNDSYFIAELRNQPIDDNLLKKDYIKYMMRKLAEKDRDMLKKKVDRAINQPGIKQIIIATHVPPFEVITRYNNLPTSKDFLPFYCNVTLGEYILRLAKSMPSIKFKVLCGHTHEESEIEYLPNLNLHVGGSVYGQPKLSGVLEL